LPTQHRVSVLWFDQQTGILSIYNKQYIALSEIKLNDRARDKVAQSASRSSDVKGLNFTPDDKGLEYSATFSNRA